MDARHGAAALFQIGHHRATPRGRAEEGPGIEGTGPMHRGELAQAMADGDIARDAQLTQQSDARQRRGDDRRLGHRGRLPDRRSPEGRPADRRLPPTRIAARGRLRRVMPAIPGRGRGTRSSAGTRLARGRCRPGYRCDCPRPRPVPFPSMSPRSSRSRNEASRASSSEGRLATTAARTHRCSKRCRQVSGQVRQFRHREPPGEG